MMQNKHQLLCNHIGSTVNILCWLFFIPLLIFFFGVSATGDQTGECRAHGNLGSAFFSKGNYREALTNHRNQLVLAMKLKDREVRNTHIVGLKEVTAVWKCVVQPNCHCRGQCIEVTKFFPESLIRL